MPPTSPTGSPLGQIASEWLRVLALWIGLSATPILASQAFLLQRLPWLANHFWIAGLVCGALLAGAGVIFVARQRQTAAPRPAQGPVVTWLYVPALTIALGIFILLPAVVALLAQAQRVENAARMASFFGAPAILLWVAVEWLCFAGFEPANRPGRLRLLGILQVAAQTLGAVSLWVFLGLSLGFTGLDWLFGIGAGLALLGAVLSTAAMLFMGVSGRGAACCAPTADPIHGAARPGADV